MLQKICYSVALCHQGRHRAATLGVFQDVVECEVLYSFDKKLSQFVVPVLHQFEKMEMMDVMGESSSLGAALTVSVLFYFTISHKHILFIFFSFVVSVFIEYLPHSKFDVPDVDI